MSNAPTIEQYLKGNVRWRETYKGIGIELSFHGYTKAGETPYEDITHGTWCYYLLLNELMFRPEDWEQMLFTPYISDFGRETYDYYNFPDVDFHSGITFYEVTDYYDGKVKRRVNTIKVGCDYNHLWDREAGYPDNYDSVLFDAKRSVSKLLERFPDVNKRCSYSGIWDRPEKFYTAKGGMTVHESYEEKLREDGWENWLRQE